LRDERESERAAKQSIIDEQAERLSFLEEWNRLLRSQKSRARRARKG